MRKNAIKQRIAAGDRIVNGWCAIANSYATEVYAHQGWDSVTIDMQHGPVDFQAAVTMLQAISTTNAVPMARVPWNDPALIMKMLDAGAYGLVCPMINSKAEAEAFVRRVFARSDRTARYNTPAPIIGSTPTMKSSCSR